MIVAIDIRFAYGDYQQFIYQTFSRLVVKYPQHSFNFIFNKNSDLPLFASENITAVQIEDVKIPLLAQFINNKKLAASLKKYKADVFITAKTLRNIDMPQCLIFNGKDSIKSLLNAKTIITFSAFLKKKIIDSYKINEEKIKVIYAGIDAAFQPVNFEEREKLKDQFSDGKEYFLCMAEKGSASNLLNLLQAFSLFKKWQKSSMQLVIVASTKFDQKFTEQLNLYKYKSEIKIYIEIPKEELIKVSAAAYAMIYLSNEIGFYTHALEAMKCDVPVIAANNDTFLEICGPAALYINADDEINIAEKMMLMFKDEKLRSESIEKGKDQMKKFSWDYAAEQLWQSIEKEVV